jgi:hypothetical protein
MKAAPPKLDVARMSQKLRLQTCALLKLDPENLSPGDEALVARVGALKLLDDRFHETDHGTGNLLADSSFVVDRTKTRP